MAMFDLSSMSGGAPGKGGAPGTASEPWNPAAKLAQGMPPTGIFGGVGRGPNGAPVGQPPGAPPDANLSTKLGYAVMPQTMAGKGGASGG